MRGEKINAQKAQLTALQAHLAAWVDFPEEDVPELDPAHLRTVLGAVREELDALIRSYDAGAVLREGVDCAIVDAPTRASLPCSICWQASTVPSSPWWRAPPAMEQAVQLRDPAEPL